jgi:hypothetical protein
MDHRCAINLQGMRVRPRRVERAFAKEDWHFEFNVIDRGSIGSFEVVTVCSTARYLRIPVLPGSMLREASPELYL